VAAAPASAESRPVTLSHRTLWAARAEIALAEGNGEEAVRLVDDLLEGAPYLGSRGAVAIPRLARLRGEALLLLGQASAAAQLLEAASLEADRQGSAAEKLRLLLALARAARALLQPDRVTHVLAEATNLTQQLAASLQTPAVRHDFEREAQALLALARGD
jgi:hypothetical protein